MYFLAITETIIRHPTYTTFITFYSTNNNSTRRTFLDLIRAKQNFDVTEGLRVWSIPIFKKDNFLNIYLMECGLYNNELDAKIYSIVFLLSSIVVIDTRSLEFKDSIYNLRFIADFTKVLTAADNNAISIFSLKMYSPLLLLNIFEKAITESGEPEKLFYMKNLDRLFSEHFEGNVIEQDLEEIITHIYTVYKKMEGHWFPSFPIADSEKERHSNNEKIKERIFSKSRSFTLDGLTITSKMAAATIKAFIESFNLKGHANLLDLMDRIVEKECVLHYEEAIKAHLSHIQLLREIDYNHTFQDISMILRKTRCATFEKFSAAVRLRESNREIFNSYFLRLQEFVKMKELETWDIYSRIQAKLAKTIQEETFQAKSCQIIDFVISGSSKLTDLQNIALDVLKTTYSNDRKVESSNIRSQVHRLCMTTVDAVTGASQ